MAPIAKKRKSGASPRPTARPETGPAHGSRWKTPLLWFMAGLFTGAGGTGLLWIDHRAAPSVNTTAESTADSNANQEPPSGSVAHSRHHHSGKPAESTDAPTPHFDFYNLLPAGTTALGTTTEPGKDKTVTSTTAATPHPSAAAGKTLSEKTTKTLLADLQCGSYKTQDEADAMRAKILLLGLSAHIRPVQLDNQQQRFRVISGPYHDNEAMHLARQRLQQAGIVSLVFRRNPN